MNEYGGFKSEDHKTMELISAFGTSTPIKPRILKGQELIPFDKYIDYVEHTNYQLMMHCSRMTLLMKLINKSF